MQNAARDTKKMHIVYLVYADVADSSGGMRVIFEHVNGLLGRGHHVEVWVPPTKTTLPYFNTDAPIRVYADTQLSEPNIIVMTDPIFLPAMSTNRKKGYVFLLFQHDNEMVCESAGVPGYTDLINSSRHRFREGMYHGISVSSWVQDMVLEKYDLRSHLVRNGVDKALFHPAEPLSQLKGTSVLTFYDDQAWKGFGDVARALLGVAQSFPDLKVFVVGRVSPDVFMNKVASIHLESPLPVAYLRSPNQPDLARIYSSATVFVSASWKEGFGLPGLEAMACGVPVVTTDSGGNRDFAINEETALVVPQQDIAAIANGVLRVLSDEKLRTKLRRNGIQKAKELNWDKSIDRLELILLGMSSAP